MPGSKKEYKNAVEEGVEFVFNKSPHEVIVNDKNAVVGLVTQDTKLIKKDGSNRASLDTVKFSEANVDADILIYALGFSSAKPDFLSENGIEFNEWGNIEVDEDMQTSVPGIYAGGDVRRGTDLVVTAALDGRVAAKAIVSNLLK